MTQSPNYLGLPNLKYQLVTGFLVNQWFIPPATIIDTSRQEFAWLFNVLPPMDAIPLDQATYQFFTSSGGTIGCGYPYWAVRYGPNVVPINP
jgi:hypothetical protein